ncbi:hypothetical protein IO99_00685 [Clostridium sulfidigenes]|uniref:Hemolysin XhlA n=1 Tax=Clostridium sulfidigenes TaxID=318464 RepID=A0A084JIE1_9CLOT|nr:hemolysin XhlA family protein [Clostridium sulfidigenes]KEZ88725.1 hypothetical protein IO99_00685 [Clostridium sulfidigenes]HAR85446.1 hemolysin XhlA [Clostridium sp.]
MADENTQEIKERLVRIETLLEVNNKDLYNRVKKLEDSQTWLWRTVVGALIGGAIAIIFKI